MPLLVTRTMASVGSWIVGSGTLSTRTSRLPWKVTAFMFPPGAGWWWSICGLAGGQPLVAQRGVEGLGEQRPELLGGGSLVGQDSLRQLRGLRVSGSFRHPPQKLIAGGLEVLESVGKGTKLGRRIRLGSEERAPVQRPHTQHSVLELRRRGAAGLQSLLHPPEVILGLTQVLLIGGGQFGRAGQVWSLAQQLDRLRLQGVDIG